METLMPSAPKANTGEVLYDLPSPYLPHPATGLLHLPRFLAKIRKHLKGELPKSYQRNFCRGFDGFLCAHLGVDAKQVVELVRVHGDDPAELDRQLLALFPKDVRAYAWNREVVQKGMAGMGRERLEEVKKEMGLADRADLLSFADMIEYDEGRIV
ncbi:MAG TPA: DUF5069 domain-containing protein [Opitutales bacterium]|nr:DUF5069 domain-containing protein [Opitutales bacterium]